MHVFCYIGYLDKLAPHLCDVYKRTRFLPKQYMWPPNQPELFKNLTFLQHDSQFKQKQLSHIAARYRHTYKSCSTNELKFDIKNAPMFKQLEEVHLSICKSNATKNIDDLFAHEGNLKPRSILVEGAPGVGKTELIKQIAYLWAKCELINEMKLVFVLYLRDPNIHGLKSIEDFIHQYVNSANRYLSTKEAEGVIQELRDSRGCNIAFLMDGFDEFPSRVYGNSFVAGLIRGEVLPNALLVITSRPIVSLFMHSQVNRVFDIVGFDKEEKEKYISESLRNLPEKQNELQQYLKQYPLINSYCYIPLHLSMVIFLLKLASLPETLTKINKLFILRTISRNLRQRGKVYKKLCLTEFTDLPREVYDIVLQLSKLAYDGVQESKLVFTLEEIKQVCPDVDNTQYAMNAFGLLQAVEHYNPLATEVTASFNFLHYSMQEYLAAFYISTLSDKDQYSIMVSVKPLRYALSPAQHQNTEMSSFWHNQFVFMWLMYVGITCAKSYAFTLFLCNSGFFATTGKASNKLKSSLSIVQVLHLFQCFVEANNVQACNALLEHIFRDGNVCIKGIGTSYMPLFSHHMLSLVFFLAKSPRLHKSLEFTNCFFLDDAMNTLEEYFLTHRKKGSSIKSIHFENSSIVSKSGILGTVMKLGHVSNISIVNIRNYDVKNMIELLGHNRKLNTLKIQEMGLMDNSIDLLMQQLSRTTVQSLSIANNYCSSSVTESIANFMSRNSTLQILNISENLIGMSEEAVQHLVKDIIPVDFFGLHSRAGVKVLSTALEKDPPLLSLNLSNNCIPFVKELALALSYNKVLISLDLSINCLFHDDQSSFNVFGSALRINNTLKSLNISDNDISDTKMNDVVEALYYNKTLQFLDISNNKLSSHTTEYLAHALGYNNYLSLLALGSNSIGDEGAIHLASALKQNMALTSLYLRDNMITNVGAMAIADALGVNKVLQKLDLSMNDISDKGTSALCNTFYNKSALKVLFIVFNPVNNKDIFTKFASEDTTCYCQNHIPITNYGFVQPVTEVTVNNGNKGVEYCLKLPVPTSSIWYATTNDKRMLVFTSEISYYNGWKNYFHKNMHFRNMYAYTSINYPYDRMEEECLQCYIRTVFNSL